MRNTIGWMIAAGLFCWGVVSAFSIFAELKFLVDGWDWSIGHAPISVKAMLLAVGKWVSARVTEYREFVHGLVLLLHLPQFPSWVYDVSGVVTFSIARGRWLGQRGHKELEKWAASRPPPPLPDDKRRQGLSAARYARAFVSRRHSHKVREGEERFRYFRRYPLRGTYALTRNFMSKFLPFYVAVLAAQFLVFGGAVAVILAALFGIDWLYRSNAIT